MARMPRRAWCVHMMRAVFPSTLAVVLLSLSLNSCKKSESARSGAEAVVPAGALELVFTYGSEKEKWIGEVTDEFNREQHKTSSGKTIWVRAIPMGSGECIDELLSGRRQAHLTSPASAAFVKLGNAESRAKYGRDLIGPTENLVLSPVVIAMWKPMAEAIGWGKKQVGWSDVLALAKNDRGWEAYGYPQWGQFKFGHTHPQYSNSGLISLLAEVYAASGKTKGLTLEDVRKPRTAQYLGDIEKSVVHYGSSTGFFGREMFASGPQYLSAAVLYENMVIESYSQQNLPFPVVAIYPKEGTFWSDHPAGVVEREWVTPDHRDAAQVYIKYLLASPQQQRAISYGFRPASLDVPLSAPLDSAHGVDPKEPQTTLEVPAPEVINAVLGLFQHHKKRSEVTLVLDTSGSMQQSGKLTNAREGAKQLISLLGDDDTFSLVPFSSNFAFAAQDIRIRDGRAEANRQIDSLFASGGTALYDAIDAAFQSVMANRKSDRIQAVVVLTDGDDTESKMKLQDLMSRIRSNGETRNIRVFTIAYGRDARRDILKSIADATHARSYEGNPENIVGVFKDVSTFF